MALELTHTDAAAPRAAATAKSGVAVTRRDRRFLTEQLALLLDTGANLHAALRILSRQSQPGKLRALLDDLAENISGGRSFSAALERHPRSFDPTYVNLVRAGEEGGFLPRVLEQLLTMEERSAKLRSDLVSAVSYPAFLLAFSAGVVLFVLVVVFPKFGDMFGAIADQLPPTTKVLMAVSDLLRENALVVSGTCIAVGVLVVRWLMSGDGRRWRDRFVLRTPVVRSLFVPLYLVQSLRVMSLSLANGVTVVDTLAACRDVVRNHRFAAFIAGVERSVNDGAGIAAGFRQADFVPDIVKEMVATGEESGALPRVMERVADHYENELAQRLALIARMAEPAMLVIMGLVVGVLVSSLILPIFQLSRAVH